MISKFGGRKTALPSMEHEGAGSATLESSPNPAPSGRRLGSPGVRRELGRGWAAEPRGVGRSHWGSPRLLRAPRPAILCAWGGGAL